MRSDVLELVRSVNPVSRSAGDDWARSDAAERMRMRIETRGPDREAWPNPAGRRPWSPRVRIAIVVAALLVLAGGIAGAAAVILGRPAPEQVKEHLRGVDTGLPADLRLNPDVVNARSVATTGESTLYLADLRDGGYCTEIVTGTTPRGATCTTGAQTTRLPIDVAVPTTDPVSAQSEVTLGGHVNVPSASSLAIRYGEGSEDPIPFGTDHYFVFDVPTTRLASVHAGGFELIARDASGAIVGRGIVPADFDNVSSDDHQPIFVSTISDQSDVTKVLGVEGSVNVDGATSLELRYPDGVIVPIPLAADGSFRYDLPAARESDLFRVPGELIARDASGRVVARAPVAAVAYWRGQERSGP